MLFRPTALRTAVMAPPRAQPWAFTGTHWLTSDGALGSYADAATSDAARVFLDGSGPDPSTLAMWVKPTGGGFIYDITDDAAPGLRGLTFDGDEWDPEWKDDGTNSAGVAPAGLSAGATWHHIAVSITATGATFYVDAVAKGGGEQSTSGFVFATAASALTLFADYAHANPLAGSILSPAIWSSALSAGQVASLYGLGVAGDPRTIAGGPVHWWPADGDSGTTVTDRGSAGTCNLTLHGGVTIGS